jgi:hypothetical protein
LCVAVVSEPWARHDRSEKLPAASDFGNRDGDTVREFYYVVRFVEVLAAFLIVIAACISFAKWLKRK